MAACAEKAAQAAGVETVMVYASLSSVSGGKEVFALLKSDSKTTKEIIDEVNANPNVIAVSPNYIKYAAVWPDDPRCSELWGMAKINAPAAWDVTIGSDTNNYIAVADSGIDVSHPDLAGNVDLALSRNFVKSEPQTDITDNDGHGTHISGTIAAVGNNALGVTGVNWRTRLLVLKTMEKRDGGVSGYNSDFADAIDYIIKLLGEGKHISALNLSISGFEPGAPESHSTDDILWSAFKRLSDLNQTLIVVSAGNGKPGIEVGKPVPKDTGDGPQLQYVYPASYVGVDNMVVVGAIDEDDGAASFSNYSATLVDIAAPGVGILSTLPGGGYGYKQGTSMATPHVVGVVGLMASVAPSKTAAELKSILLNNADDSNNPMVGTQRLSHYGTLDAAAVETIAAYVAPPSGPFTLFKPLEPASVPTSRVTIPINWPLPDKTLFHYWLVPTMSGGAYSAELRQTVSAVYDPYNTWLENGAIEVDVSSHTTRVERGVYLIRFEDETKEYVGATAEPLTIDPAANADGTDSDDWWERWGCSTAPFVVFLAAMALPWLWVGGSAAHVF
ncbi:MAG: S8 family serine peptidase [Synergistaceae bacterium]|jgi:subtilisin family serine protease|nr:S8 family serine peptidase [Synergistaceae bacterium]